MSALTIQENVPLSPLTTFKLGGPARHFCAVSSTTELLDALALASQNNWPFFVLAGGSNLIISDDGFDGLVVKLELGTWDLELDKRTLTAGASCSMKEIVDASIEAGLAGLEWAGGLPGSFGGAIYGNAGCYGGEIKDSVLAVKSLTHTGEEKTRDNKDCDFGYRDSIFKHVPEVIVFATLQLQPGNRTELRQIADDHIGHRASRHPLEHQNVGSIFKNIRVEDMPSEHLATFRDSIKDDPFPVVPTAKIIATAALQGRRVGNVQLSEKHSNFIVNLGGGTTADLLKLVEQIKSEIDQRYGIKLEVEPQLVGFKH